jgi:glycogen operon protein
MQGRPIVDDSFYLILNAHSEALTFVLPARKWGEAWIRLFDTAEPESVPPAPPIDAGASMLVSARSLVLLQRTPGPPG